MNPEAWVLVSRATLYITVALLVCLFLRRPLRKLSGATAAYAIWSCVPLALVAAVLPGPSLGVAVPRLPALTALPALSSVQGQGQAWASWLAAAWLGGAVVMAFECGRGNGASCAAWVRCTGSTTGSGRPRTMSAFLHRWDSGVRASWYRRISACATTPMSVR